MPRPPMPIGTWGEITTRKIGKVWEARGRFRDYDGKTRQAKRTGSTAAAARDALKSAFASRQPPNDSEVTSSARLTGAATMFFDELEAAVAAENKAQGTLTRYREIWRSYIEPALGNYLIREVTVPVVDRFLKAVTKNVGAPTGKHCRNVLSGVCKVAVRHGAMPANPVREAAPVHVKKPEPRALTVEEVARLRAQARWHASGAPDATGKTRRGRPPLPDTADVIDLLLTTGARIGEILALRWSDVDLGEEPTISIAGTLTEIDGVWTRQEWPKAERSRRLLQLPPLAVETLMRRRVEMLLPTKIDAVFPSTLGTWRDPNNVRTRFRKIAAAAGITDISPHNLRKTVATFVDAEHGIDIAAKQLGNTTEVVRRHYVQRRHVAPDVKDVLQRIVPDE